MGRKFLLIGLSIIILVTFLQISIYFFYFYKPVDRLLGKDLSITSEIPSVSELLTPSSISKYVLQADETKKIYSDRVDIFSKEVQSVAQSDSSFLKTVETSYVLGGIVKEAKPLQIDDKSDEVSYDLLLYNSTGKEYVVHLSSSDLRYAQIYLKKEITDNNLGVEKTSFSPLPGDYVTIKYINNLLNRSEVRTTIEIFRPDK
jgi:hypothetical protein